MSKFRFAFIGSAAIDLARVNSDMMLAITRRVDIKPPESGRLSMSCRERCGPRST